MKLNFLRKDVAAKDVLFEDTDADGEIKRPFGIEEEHWNADLKRRLVGLKKSNPKLYAKIVQGD